MGPPNVLSNGPWFSLFVGRWDAGSGTETPPAISPLTPLDVSYVYIHIQYIYIFMNPPHDRGIKVFIDIDKLNDSSPACLKAFFTYSGVSFLIDVCKHCAGV